MQYVASTVNKYTTAEETHINMPKTSIAELEFGWKYTNVAMISMASIGMSVKVG